MHISYQPQRLFFKKQFNVEYPKPLFSGRMLPAGDSISKSNTVKFSGWYKPNMTTTEILAQLKQGKDIDEANEAGETALIQAASQGRTDIVEFLLDNGAYIEHKDNQGKIAFTHACNARKTDTIITFLKRGPSYEYHDPLLSSLPLDPKTKVELNAQEFLPNPNKRKEITNAILEGDTNLVYSHSE